MNRYTIIVRKVWDFAADNGVEFDHLAERVVARQATHDYLTEAGIRAFVSTDEVEIIAGRLATQAIQHGAKGVA